MGCNCSVGSYSAHCCVLDALHSCAISPPNTVAIRGGGQVSACANAKRRSVVAGWNVGFTFSQFFDHPEDRILLPNKYVSRVSKKLDAPAPGRVFYVTGRTRLLPPFTPAEAAEMNRRSGGDQIVIGPPDDSGPGTLRGSEARIQNFGQVEVTVYRGDTARALLQEWREDLLRRTAGRIYPSFQGDYQLLALLEEQLPSGESADHWRLLAERCRAEDLAMREIPRHLQKIAQLVSFP